MVPKLLSIFGILMFGTMVFSESILAQTVSYDSIPQNYQLYPRDKTDSDSAVVTISGLVADAGQTYDSVTVDVDSNGVSWRHFVQALSYSNPTADTAYFSLHPKIYADTVEFSFDVTFWAGSTPTQDAFIDSVVCGDVFLVSGGSHAAGWAEDFVPYQIQWVRTYGTMTDRNGVGDDNNPNATAEDSIWGIAHAVSPDFQDGPWHLNVGIIGLRLGKLISQTYGIPVSIMCGAAGGVTTKRHIREDSNPDTLTTIYGRLLYRVEKAGLANDVSAMLWWAGENNAGSQTLVDNYVEHFISLRNDWPVDYPSLEKILSTQIPVGGGAVTSGNGAGAADILREHQRTLALAYPETDVMAAHDIGGFVPPDSIYHTQYGYETMADRYFGQIRRDLYNYLDTGDLDPPNINRAYFSTAQKDTLVLEFNNADTLFWQSDTVIGAITRYMKDYFYLHHTGGGIDSLIVDSGFVSNVDNLKLVLNGPSNADSVSYLPDSYYNGTTTLYEGPWVRNSKNIPALSFYAFPIDSTFGDVNTSAPILTSIADQNVNEGDILDIAVSSTDPDGNEITLTVNNLPTFGSFTDSGFGAGSLQFTPSFGDTGVYPDIKVIATDDGIPSKSDTVSFTLTVNDSNRAPVLTAISSQSVNENDALDVVVSSTDADGDNIALTVNNLPAFGSFTDSANGMGSFRFTPTFDDSGSYSIDVIATDNGSPSAMSDTVSFTLTVNNINRAPVLSAIASQGMNEGDTLDVSVISTDPDGDNITLSVNNLPTFGSFTDSGNGTGSFHFTPGFDTAGVYTNIEVIATDNGSPSAMSDTVSFTLTVNNINRAPVLSAIAPQGMNENDTLDVAVSSTDPDGNGITLSASNLPSFASFTDNGDGTGTIGFVTGFDDAGSYPGIEVVATDDGSPSLSDTTSFTLTVDEVNRAPILTPIAAQGMNEDDTLDVAISSTDPDGNSITLSASNLPSFASFTDNGDGTGTIGFVTGFDDAGSYPGIEVVVTDNGSPSLSDTTSFTLTVTEVNRAPVLTGIPNQSMDEGDTLVVALSSTDPDGNNISLAANNLPSFGSLTDNGDGTGTLRFIAGFDTSGVYSNIEVVAADNGSPSLSDTVLFTLTVTDVNRAPVLTPIADQNMNEDDTLVVNISATDPDGDNITLTVNNLPSFGSITDNGDGTGTIRFIAGFDDAGTYSNIRVIAIDDGNPLLAAEVSFNLTVSDVNRTPVLTSITDQGVNEGDTLDVGVSSTDPDGDNITLMANNLPLFGSFSDNGDGTGSFRFTPGFDDAGTYPNLAVIATDNGSPSLSDTVTFTLTVDNVNRAPVLSSISSQSVNEGDTLDVGVSSTDPDGNSITLTTNNVPTFGTFTDNGDGTGSFRFSPGFGDTGVYPGIEVVAMDNGSPSLSDTVSFTLSVGDVNRAPVLTPIAAQNMNEGDTLDVAVSSTDPDGDNITLSANNLPSFASFTDSGDGTGSFRFIADFNDAGIFQNIEVTATDDGNPSLAATVSFDLTVANINRAPVLASISSQNMNEGDTLVVDVSSTDPDGDDITLVASNVPSFGNFTNNGDGTGSFSFTPNFNNAGSYPNVRVIAIDNGNPTLSDTMTFTLTVDNVNRAPVLTPLSNLTMNEGEILVIPVSANDPDGDSLNLTANNLPSFGSFTDNGNGTGSFRFTAGFDHAGTYSNIELIATDNGSPALSDTVAFTLTVDDVNRAPILASIPHQNMNENDTLDVDVSSTDPDGHSIVLTANNVPSFGSFTDNGDGTGSFQFITTFGHEGVYPDIDVVATDNGSPSLTDTVTFSLAVGNVNRAPILTSIPAQNMNENDTLDVTVTSIDPDGDNITLTAGNLPSFGNFTDNGDGTGVINFITNFDNAGVYTNIRIIASDNASPSLSDTVLFTLTVNNINRAPVLTSIPAQNMNEGDTLDVGVSSVDPDGNSISLVANNLPPFGSFTDNGDGTGTINFTATFGDSGVYADITVIATDNGNPTLADTTSFTLTVGDVNRAPILTSISAQNMNEGDTLEVSVSSTDPDGDSIQLIANNLPSFGSFTDNGDGTGIMSFTAGFADAGVYPNLEVVATDNGSPSLADTVSFTLTVNDINREPVAVDDADTTAEDTAITLDVLANDSDPDGDSLAVSGVTQGSNGTVVINGDQTLTYEPNANFYGTDSFTYIVNDGKGATDTAAVLITITSVNDLPVITSLPDSIGVNADTSATLNIWDFVEDVETPDSLLLFQFSANPDSLVFDYDTSTGFLTVSTLSNFTGEVNVSIMVSDTDGGTAEDSLVVIIHPAVGIDDPLFSQIPKEFVLMQNYPNPFNPLTNIRFGLPVASQVLIEIYNILGQRVVKLLEERKPAGYHVVQLDASKLGSGLYLYRIQAENFNQVKKMLLVK